MPAGGTGRSKRISVCIVNWNTRDALRACLKALGAAQLAEDVEVLVVEDRKSVV